MKNKTNNKFNGLTIDELVNVILTIDNAHTPPQWNQDCA